MQWYYAVGDQRVGPVSEAQFRSLVSDGTIRADTLVWKAGMANWLPYSSVQGAPPTPPPAPVSPVVGGMAVVDDGTEVCAVDGQRYPRREMLQYEGKWIAAQNRDIYLQRQREGVVQPGTMNYAGFWPRFCAKFIDGIVLWVVSLIVNGVLSFAFFGSANVFGGASASQGVSKALAFTALTMLLGFGEAITYAWFFITRFDATPGKMALGLKVLRADGSKLSPGRIVGRYFAEIVSGLILCIGYIMAAFDEEKRALHDRICDTRVIKAK